MKCFVACAFGDESVDKMYDDVICPVLREAGVQPVRVDKEEHNDNIDKRIMKSMDEAQICIADLTNARPSVYYEAGYMEGTKKSVINPVIFVARDDHKRARDSDPKENLRVHFDLLTKNIIWWKWPITDDSIEIFKESLAKRLRYVMKTLLRDNRESEAIERDRKEFASQSENVRLASLLVKATAVLRAQGYKKARVPEKIVTRSELHYMKMFGGKWMQVHVFVLLDLPRGIFQYNMVKAACFGTIEEPTGITEIESTAVFVGVRKWRLASLQNAFSSWTPTGNSVFEQVTGAKEWTDFSGEKTIKPQRLDRIAFIDAIQSTSEFTSRLLSVIRS